jgi:NADH-quinone oxidoreductase subunit G
MATIFVDNQPYEIADGQNLLTACLSLGLNLPYFCWHPALHSVGSCRLCAVKVFRDEQDTRGRIVMACMTPATEGTRISIDDPEAREFRAAVIEWLMIGHPHDCPVCDEGGECHLQDMTVMTGHAYRRTRMKKRTYRNQDLGPFIHHEMNRCIQCYRCVRYYREYAGGRDFNVFGIHNRLYYGRFENGKLENEFSGNLVEVCPTGVFTDKTLRRHYSRKWDLQTAPSVCVHCGEGCNILPGERYGMVRRVLNRFNKQVNGYFLCDRGRFGYEFVNDPDRLKQPLAATNSDSDGNRLLPVSAAQAVGGAREILAVSKGVVGIGSPRASLEANYALRRLVGPGAFSSGMAALEHELMNLVVETLRLGAAPSASLLDVEQSDATVILGEDVTNTAPRVALALRQSVKIQPIRTAVKRLRISEWSAGSVKQAIQEDKGPLFIASVAATRLDDIATATYHRAPDDIARLGFAVAAALDPRAPRVTGLSDAESALAARIAAELLNAERPLVVSGLGAGNRAVIEAAAGVATALQRKGKDVRIRLCVPECNSVGVSLLGGFSLDAAMESVMNGTAETVVILENDLHRRLPADSVAAFLQKARHVIVLDSLPSSCSGRASVVFPAATFAESDGTLVNSEGRAQRFFQVFVPQQDIRESWRWLGELIRQVGSAEGSWSGLDELISAMAGEIAVLHECTRVAPNARFRISGQKVARQAFRSSGRTAMLANVSVHEPKPPQDSDSALAFSMEGFQGQPPSPLIARYWAPGWNSVQSLNKFQSEVGGPLRGGDPGIRLLEPKSKPGLQYSTSIPEAVRTDGATLHVVPGHHIFGSEELSNRSPGVASCAPAPYVGLNPDDLSRLGVEEGEAVMLDMDGCVFHGTVRVIPSLATGLAVVPTGLRDGPVVPLPARAKLAKSEG